MNTSAQLLLQALGDMKNFSPWLSVWHSRSMVTCACQWPASNLAANNDFSLPLVNFRLGSKKKKKNSIISAATVICMSQFQISAKVEVPSPLCRQKVGRNWVCLVWRRGGSRETLLFSPAREKRLQQGGIGLFSHITVIRWEGMTSSCTREVQVAY